MRARLFLVTTMFACAGLAQRAAAQGGGDLNPNLKSDAQAVKRFLDLRLGLSIHWGPSSQTGYEISWSRGRHRANQRQFAPVEQYDALYKTFNPTKFNAAEWARLMNRWGMRYVLPTGKHHDGFSLWFSKYSNYTVKNTPFKRDIMKELGDAVRRHGIVFGSYYSNLDWYHPDWPAYRGGPGPLFAKHPDSPKFDRYLEYMRNQLTELIKDYGVEILQFDGEWDAWNHEVGSQMYRYLHELAPTVILSSRVDVGRQAAKNTGGEWNWKKYGGDYEERERYVSWLPSNQAEVRSWADHPCQSWITIDKRQWAWNPDPDLVKSEELIRNVVTIVGSNCNVAINVSPRPDGTFHPDQIAIMDKLGRWLEENGPAIYGTRGGPFYPAEWGVSTRSGKRSYVHVLNWPQGRLLLPPLKEKVVSTQVLAGGHKVQFRQSSEGIEVTVPERLRDKVDTIIALDFDRAPGMQAGTTAKQ
jgi:alpha-L-fucosidase